jgi:hypothetical protein
LILGDFGITLPSPAAERLTGTEPVHSPNWMPDWVQFDDDYTPAVDVFSWAKVLHFLIAGRNVTASHVDDSTAALSEKFGDARGLSSVNDLLRRCIVTKKKLVTISTAADLIIELDRILRDESRAPGYLIFSFLHPDRNSPVKASTSDDGIGWTSLRRIASALSD